MNTSLSDEEIIHQYLTKQPIRCFETLYNRYANKVYRHCLSMTKDPLKAEDFTHDIFLKVFNKLDAFQERSRFATWLYSIVYNYCSDQLRLAKRLNVIPINDVHGHSIADSNEEQAPEETWQLLNRILATRSASEQAILRLKYEEDLSIQAIAQRCNLTESTVKMRLKRSRDRIYKLYQKLSRM
ncbi:RNA polymerase sigma factor [Spirosoma areae]